MTLVVRSSYGLNSMSFRLNIITYVVFSVTDKIEVKTKNFWRNSFLFTHKHNYLKKKKRDKDYDEDDFTNEYIL